jgi:rSAM/selenodomain-associated transferase 1
MTKRPVVVIMAKAPRLGAGKSRLARDVGRVEAWRVNRRLHALTMRSAFDPRWRTVLCVAPDQALTLRAPGVWPDRCGRIPQGRGDLGTRMARALRRYRVVVMIGTDCPSLTRTDLASALAALRRRPFVLGPAHDGGFWLLAARNGAEAARAMLGVRWSTRHAAADVIANLGAGRVALLQMLRDVDVGADLQELQRSARRRSSGV